MDRMEQLVMKAAEGDMKAFEEIYKETYKKVYFTCMAFLKNEQDAADVSQDIYITVIKGLPTLKDKSKFESWLGVITVNKCKDFLKKSKPVLIEEEDLAEQITEENELLLPEEYVTNKAKRKILMDIMKNNLSDTLYQTVIMFYFQNMSAAEIAEIMDCPVGTITSRLCLARAKIKDAILEYEKKSGDKLYSVALVPVLALLFKEEANAMEPAYMCDRIIKAASTQAATAPVASNVGGKIMLKSLKAKIIAGLAAVVVIGGVIAAVASNSGEDETDIPVSNYEENYDDYSDGNTDYSEAEDETYLNETEDVLAEEEYVDDYEAQQSDYQAMAENMLAQADEFFEALKTGDTAALKEFAMEDSERYEEFIELCEIESTSRLFATLFKDVKYIANEETMEELIYDLECAYEWEEDGVNIKLTYSVPYLMLMKMMYPSCFAEGTEVSVYVDSEAKAYEMLEDALSVTPRVARYNLWVSLPDENGKIQISMENILDLLQYNYWNFYIDENIAMEYVQSEVNPSNDYNGTLIPGRTVEYGENHDMVMEIDRYLSAKDFVGFGNYISAGAGEDYIAKFNENWGDYNELTDTQKQFVDNFVAEKLNYQFIEFQVDGDYPTGMMIITYPILDDFESHEPMLTDWYAENEVMDTTVSYPETFDYDDYSDFLYMYYKVINYAMKYVE